jgi:dihydroxyacetone kinase
MKKILDNPDNVIDDMVLGFLTAHSSIVSLVGDTGRALVRTQRAVNKVGIVIGGGSGHEPAFLGYVGKGLADGVALGNIFASPSPDPIMDAARAVNTGRGILLIYGNYAGDCMNFEMAADGLEEEGIPVRRVIVSDDVASATDKADRRGIAGEVLIYKIAGGLAEEGFNLDDVARITQDAADSTFSIGAAWTPCTLPQTGLPSFEIGENEMEIGLGVHGEPGIQRRSMTSAEELANIMLTRIVAVTPPPLGPVSVLINGLGSTSLMELYLFYNQVHRKLQHYGAIEIKALVGNYITSQEMGGCSVSVMRLDDQRTQALLAPCHAIGWTQLNPVAP